MEHSGITKSHTFRLFSSSELRLVCEGITASKTPMDDIAIRFLELFFRVAKLLAGRKLQGVARQAPPFSLGEESLLQILSQNAIIPSLPTLHLSERLAVCCNKIHVSCVVPVGRIRSYTQGTLCQKLMGR